MAARDEWAAVTQPAAASAQQRAQGLAPAALRRAESAERAEDAAAAHVASKSKTLFERLFRLRGRLSSADSLEPSPARHPPVGAVDCSTASAGAAVASDRGPAGAPPHAPVAALLRSLHPRGKSALSDSNSSGGSDGSEPPASDSAASAGWRSGRGRRLVERYARVPHAPRPTTAAPADDRGSVLMESELTKIAPHRYWHSKRAYFVLEEEAPPDAGAAAAAGARIVLRQYRTAEDARARRLELVVSQIALSARDVVRALRQEPPLPLGLELLFARAEERPEVSVWASAAAQPAPTDRGSGLHSLRLVAADAATHAQWLRALAAGISRLIIQSHRHYANGSPSREQRRRAVVPRDADERSMRATGCSPIRAKVAPIQYCGARRGDRLDADAAAKDGGALADSGAGGQASRWPRSQDRAPATAGDRRRQPRSNGGEEEDWESDGEDRELESKRGSHGCGRGGDNQTEDEAGGNQEEEDARPHSSLEHGACVTPSDPGSESTVYQCSEPEQRDVSDHETDADGEDAARRSGKVAPAPPSAAEGYCGEDSGESPNNNGSGKTVEDDGAPAHSRGSYGARYMRTDMAALLPFVRSQTHTFNAGGQVFTLDTRYRLLKSVGNGAYGAVVAVKDAVSGEKVAIKKITSIFEDLVDAKRILREVRLLRHLDHKNVMRLLDLAPPPSKKLFEDVYIVTELMETDLHQVIYSMQPMSDDHVKYFLYQMLCALQHIHSAGVLHRDMKPSNILLNSNCDLKVCDFGLARGGLQPAADADADALELTEYVVTRWYRAPEIMLNCLHYTAAIDVWAVGCIFAEMLLREPLFPGNDYIHQLMLIVKFLGTPKQEDIAFVKNTKALRFLAKLPISKPNKWRDVFTDRDVNPLAVDLLAKMLLFNPAKRISVDDALRHPYLATFFDEVDLKPSPAFDFAFDLPDDQLTRDALVDLLCEDVQHFHPSLGPSLTPAPPPAVSSAGSRFFRLGMTASAS